VVAPIYNWSGFYIGLNGGGGSAHKCWDLIGVAGGAIPAPGTTVGDEPEGCHNATGGTVGGQIGYRWQATSWVFGVEAQGNWADFKGSNINQARFVGPDFIDQSKMDAFGLFTGQVGWAWNNVLFYVKGGAAVVDDKYSLVVGTAGSVAPVGFLAGTGSETRWGGAVGAGVEFGFAPGWSVGVEYDHLFLGKTDTIHPLLPPFSIDVSLTQRISQNVDIGLVRVNYTFGGPVVARY
jgi:outer membrane immunogenic protein